MSILNSSEQARAASTMMGQLYGALASAQGEFPEIPKTKQGHGYKYAAMADILRAVRPILSKNGLAVFQSISGDVLVTTLAHKGGATLVSQYPLVQDGTGRMNNIQRMGAALTYARRYSLTALLGVAADEDIDASDVDMERTGQHGGTPMGAALKDAWKDGVLDSLPENATDRDKAKAFAEQIIKDMQAAKTPKSVNSVWDKRMSIIEALDTKHNDLYQSVFDCFHACVGALEGDK